MTLPGWRSAWTAWRSACTAWCLWTVGVLALVGLLMALAVGAAIAALAVGAAVLVHPPLFATLRPWWPPLAVVGLASTAASYWLLWGRRR